MDDRGSMYVHQSLNDLPEKSPALGGIRVETGIDKITQGLK